MRPLHLYCLFSPLLPLRYTTADGNPRNKIVFIYWSPDTAKVKSKMVWPPASRFLISHRLTSPQVYAASKDELKKKLVGVATEVPFLHIPANFLQLASWLSQPMNMYVETLFFRCKPQSALRLITPQCLSVSLPFKRPARIAE